MKTKNTPTHDHPGRPKYRPSWPRSAEWTFADLMAANDVETNPKSKKFGKGPNCSMLTLRKFMDRDADLKNGSEIVIVKDKGGKNVTCKPNSKSGLGRHALVYSLRNPSKSRELTAEARKLSATGVKPAVSTPRKARKVKKTVAEANAEYEAQKAALITPAVVIAPVPVPEATPETAPVEAAAAPAAVLTPTATETPAVAPEAPQAAPVVPAPVAEPVAA